MSTRCNIRVYDYRDKSSLWIYHHHDGYPAGVGKELEQFLSTGGNRLLSPNNMFKALCYIYGEEYKATSCRHGDISYMYDIEINDEKTVLTTYELLYNYDGNRYTGLDTKTREINRVEYTGSGRPSLTPREFKDMMAEICYNVTVDLSESGILDGIPDDMSADESVLRNKITEYLLKTFPSRCTIKFIEKNKNIKYENFY